MRLIDADALRTNALKATDLNDIAFDNCYPYWQFAKCIKQAPTIDAVPVVRGEWIEAKSGVMSVWPEGQVMCSVCGQRMPSQWKKMPPYCYGCGAKMEDKTDD